MLLFLAESFLRLRSNTFFVSCDRHGRLAMLGILELLRHDCHVTFGGGELDQGLTELITGFPFLYNDVLSGSS